MDAEERMRREAVRRVLADEPVADVARGAERARAGRPHPERLPRRSQVGFIRLIRSDRLLHVLDRQRVLGPDLVHEYLTATLHVRRGELEVVHSVERRLRVRSSPPPWLAPELVARSAVHVVILLGVKRCVESVDSTRCLVGIGGDVAAC